MLIIQAMMMKKLKYTFFSYLLLHSFNFITLNRLITYSSSELLIYTTVSVAALKTVCQLCSGSTLLMSLCCVTLHYRLLEGKKREKTPLEWAGKQNSSPFMWPAR
jgi:hypothetical protein